MPSSMGVLEVWGVTLSGWLTNPYVVAFIVPVGFFFIAAFGKKLIRDKPTGSFFTMSDYYLAPDAALANLGVGLAECVDLVARFNPLAHTGRIRGTLVFVAIAFFVYLMTLALHKHYESEGKPWQRCFWLLGFANLVSFGLMFIFLLAIKGVNHA